MEIEVTENIDLELPDTGRGSDAWLEKLCVEGRTISDSAASRRNWIRLGKILNTIKKVPVGNKTGAPPVYVRMGYKNLKAFSKGEFGISSRQTDYLVQLYRVFEEDLSEVPRRVRNKLLSLGYEKLRLLVSVLTPSNADEWYEIASTKSKTVLVALVSQYRDALVAKIEDAEKKQEEVRLLTAEAILKRRREQRETDNKRRLASYYAAKKGGPIQAPTTPMTQGTTTDPYAGEDEEKILFKKKRIKMPKVAVDAPSPKAMLSTIDAKVKKVFTLYEDQYDLVQQTLKAGAKIMEQTAESSVLTLICLDFLATNGTAPRGTPEAMAYFANLERIFGYKIAVFDPRQKYQVVYGMTTLVKLSQGSSSDE